MKFNFLNVDTPGEAELAHITCSGEPEHPFLSLRIQRCVGWLSLHSCAELWHSWCCGERGGSAEWEAVLEWEEVFGGGIMWEASTPSAGTCSGQVPRI